MSKLKSLNSNLKTYNIDSRMDVVNNIIVINKYPLEFDVKLEGDRIFIESKIKGWNFVTDFMDMSFEKALNYLLIKQVVFFILFFVCIYLVKSSFFNVFIISMIVIFVTIAQHTYYINYRIKHDNFKSNIIKWLSH